MYQFIRYLVECFLPVMSVVNECIKVTQTRGPLVLLHQANYDMSLKDGSLGTFCIEYPEC